MRRPCHRRFPTSSVPDGDTFCDEQVCGIVTRRRKRFFPSRRSSHIAPFPTRYRACGSHDSPEPNEARGHNFARLALDLRWSTPNADAFFSFHIRTAWTPRVDGPARQ